ncbi:Cenp-O kinetochore centromere component-domain-containing protein [Dendryphion nanum]|uniref:Cenp-O kinetochore centromere component-domain-containing protein n=1 Tax=Dendryphion nanum TaxID=256645 RepID=A0A9P9INA3_9PLEO|nr:Cenp-O kinetochore centromere component-domain-containing protein [Dendryphion nanum]
MASTENLDADILALRARLSTLHSQRANLSSILLSSPHIHTPLTERPVDNESQRKKALKAAQKQSTRKLENIYRACAGVTAYKVQDPDPNAVDNGNVLGVRIEVFVQNKFVETYHVLFNRPSGRHKTMLKVHRHTIPPCVPLRALVEKWLPQSQKDGQMMVEQDLVRFGRVLRKELVSWHLRMGAVENLKEEAGILDREIRPPKEPPFGKVLNAFISDGEDEDEEDSDGAARTVRIVDIEADQGVREVHLVWSNGQTGTVTLLKDGQVKGAVFRSAEGSRLSQLERKSAGHVDGLLQRLSA